MRTLSRCGGIGRRAGFKIQFFREWGFDSPHRYIKRVFRRTGCPFFIPSWVESNPCYALCSRSSQFSPKLICDQFLTDFIPIGTKRLLVNSRSLFLFPSWVESNPCCALCFRSSQFRPKLICDQFLTDCKFNDEF